MNIKKFVEYNETKSVDKVKKTKVGDKERDLEEPLSNDIKVIDIEGEDGEKMNSEEFEIESIIDVIIGDDDVEYGNGVTEATISTHADAGVKNYKRGDVIYITALLRKRGTTSFNSPAVQGVLRVRIVDIYYGLQYLNKVIN